ncbi:uncharacterized protein BDR25DRAFT_350444 [Lindgomyces ingoldianus]|uniref:Uncharacterized protein n=1 Tax=Lindgomyces ingoldianus TaxID=673940 RepID=A0ACB6RAI1_9PLEO|nr:uncharacterized protein BDR25DRAFT_350444 [Lindgomyces ingoldianus]KAF2476156.1 hypothetical protein BDR25DRAFT_350444 [Lindgomyces ingoldianus]
MFLVLLLLSFLPSCDRDTWSCSCAIARIQTNHVGPRCSSKSIYTIAMSNKGKLLSEKELDDYFQQYEDWATGEDQDEVPILEEEDFHMICDIIKDLFEHIRCQKNTIANLVEIGRSIKTLGGTLRKDVDSLKKLKRKATRSVEEGEDGSRVKRVRKHVSRK